MFTLKSLAFEHGQEIPRQYTGEGHDMSPPLSWGGAPSGTKSFVLICEDPDAPGPNTPWLHWLAYNISAEQHSIPASVPTEASVKLSHHSFLQGRNSAGKHGYSGPMPPPGHGWHRYHFKLIALDCVLKVGAGATREAVMAALEGHVLSEVELTGRYHRPGPHRVVQPTL
jgi:Raf kinase inhibitor-like YbhB/YbcL family protein